jgi:hypothetical protein
MTESHHKPHPHDAQHGKKAEHLHTHPSAVTEERAHATEAQKVMPTVPDELTLYTEDGKWKATIKAFKDYWLFYSAIGAQVDVFQRRETHDIWGRKTTDWVATPAEIFMANSYQGDVAQSPQVPQNPPGGPPNGGLGNFDQSAVFHNHHGELKLWAAGFFTTTIKVSGERTTPAGATLDINSVVSEIEVATSSGTMRGTVGASSYLSDNSTWG